jgi:hypothetical protein
VSRGRRRGAPGRPSPSRFRLLRRLLVAAIVAFVLTGIAAAAFVGARCYGSRAA